jgi:hypothetical protein
MIGVITKAQAEGVKIWRLERLKRRKSERCEAEVVSSRKIPTREGENTNMEGASFHANTVDHSRRSRESGEPQFWTGHLDLRNLLGAILGPVSPARALLLWMARAEWSCWQLHGLEGWRLKARGLRGSIGELYGGQ